MDEMSQMYQRNTAKISQFEEKYTRQQTVVDNCKNLVVHFEKELLETQQKLKVWRKDTAKEIREELESQINLKIGFMEENMRDHNRVISDLKLQVLELENYLVNYLPYNTQALTLKLLFYTVKDNTFFNSLVDYSEAIKEKFHSELVEGRLGFKLNGLPSAKIEARE